MGGIGKTELALQYALNYDNKYPGGICWLKAREGDIGTQIIEFSNIPIPEDLDLLAKVKYCWRNWGEDKLLIILDDIPSYKKDYYKENISPYLPPRQDKFKILMTSREKPGKSIQILELEVLSPEAEKKKYPESALKLLTALAGEKRIVCDLQNKKDYPSELCKWLGYLPLGLELVGRYLDLHPTFSIEKILASLQKRKLNARALLDPKEPEMTAQLGVATAFNLSWDELSSNAQEVGCYLSLFNSEPFNWKWVEPCFCHGQDEDEREEQVEELEELRDAELLRFNFLKIDKNNNYQVHSLIAQYFRVKLEDKQQAEVMKEGFCQIMIEIAKSIPHNPTQKDISRVLLAIPHLSHVATELIDYVDDENILWSFMALKIFYTGQGQYNQAEQWIKHSLKTCQTRLGEQHPFVAASLNNLAELYHSKRHYSTAEPLFKQALEMTKQLLGEQHPVVATGLNNLAVLYELQGRYSEAEPLYLQALEMTKQLLGEQHLDVATSLNNLAVLYELQGRYSEAEPLYLQALEMTKQLLGEQHLDVATSLNNLAELYRSQGRYSEAEPLYLQALELRTQLLGEQHPDVASSLNNLAELYESQGKYEAAEPLLIQALELRKQLLGEQHPNVASSLNNLAELYESQGRYEAAEPLLIQALEIAEQALGENHPNTKKIRQNLQDLQNKQ